MSFWSSGKRKLNKMWKRMNRVTDNINKDFIKLDMFS